LPYYLFSQESLMQMSRVLTPRGSLLINTAAELAVDDRFSQALVGTIKNIFPRVEIITGNENYTPRPIIVAVKEDDSINFTDFKTIVWPKQDVEQFILITDEFNPLETYYLKHSLELHQNNSALGQEIFFSK